MELNNENGNEMKNIENENNLNAGTK